MSADSLEKILRGWAKAYRDTPQCRFPSDPDAEFFPIDMEAAATEIERLRATIEQLRLVAGAANIERPFHDLKLSVKFGSNPVLGEFNDGK